MKKETFYIHNKLLSYKDISTNIYLEVSIDTSTEANGKWINLNPATICISLYDPKVNNNMSKISICLRYENVVRLVEQVNMLFNNSTNVKPVFTSGAVIHISQYTLKNRKELIFNFASNKNGPIIQMTILDTSSQRGNVSINLDFNIFKSIGKILKEFSDNPINTNIGLKQLLSYDRFISNIDSIKDDIYNYIKECSISNNNVRMDSVDINEYNEDPIMESDMQKNFKNELELSNGFSNVDLGLEEVLNNDKNIMTKIDQPFISSCLNYNLDSLNEIISSFICTTDKSSEDLFLPIDFIFNLIGSDLDITDYKNSSGYYFIQYVLIKMLKTYTKDFIQTGSYPTTIPALSFDKKFEKNSKLYNISIEIITIFLIYSIIINNFKYKSDDIKRTYFAMKLLFSPFIFSIDMTDNILDDLSKEYDKCEMCGMFDVIKEKYSSSSYGGKLGISKEIFDNCSKSFINILSDKETSKFENYDDVLDLCKQYNIDIPELKIKNGIDIKNYVFYKDEKESDVDKELVIHNDIEDTEDCLDKQLDIFLDCIKSIVDTKLIKDIKKSCRKYSDLVGFFKTKDIPHEIFKIKRVMDLNPTITKSQILKKSKLLKESEDVTESRVMQEDSVDSVNNEGFDVQEILSMDGI